MSDDRELALRAKVKTEMRRSMRAIRSALPAAARAARSRAIAQHVIGLAELGAASIVAGFVATRGEADPRGVLEAAWAAGKTVVLPRVDFESERLVLHRHEPGDALVEGGYGILEPSPDAPTVAPETVDFVLVPGLAVDLAGHRIGYGGGYYDRLLPTLPRAFACAIAFDFQLVAEVPTMPGDVPVHAVVTDARVVRPGRDLD